jgi:hypothetical protein
VPALPAGTRGVLRLDGLKCELPFSVSGAEGDTVRLVFALDQVTATAFRGTPERLAQKRAA